MKEIRRLADCRWISALCLAVAGAVAGCRVVEQTAQLPVRAVTAVVPGSGNKALNLPVLQLEIQRFADDYAGRTTDAIDEYSRAVGTPEGRVNALRWKLTMSSGMMMIASGPNPLANLVDIVTASSLTRMVVESRAAQPSEAAALQRWVETSKSLESNAWAMADNVLDKSQAENLRTAIREWYEANPGAHIYLARAEGLSALLKSAEEKRKGSGSLLGWVGLDPMAGLDPAVQEVTLARLLAERALYIGQRMPFLLRLQLQLATTEILNLPAVAQTLTNLTELTESSERLSRAVESASKTAAQLPGQVADERQAILTALDAQESKLRGLASEVRESLVAGEKMSTSLNTTLVTFDALMKRFGVGEPDTNTAAIPDTNSVPFNILDYAHTAEKITAMAGQLDGLVKDARSTLDSTALDKRIRELGQLSQKSTSEAKSVLNHLFVLCAGLIGLIFVCALLYRKLGPGRPKPH